MSALPSTLSSCALALFLTACSGGTNDAPAATPPAADAHGTPGAVPGSYEDWCGEHGLPESQCTRCDASLAAAFQATGDWCQEHGLPESHCKQCNPEIEFVRPPKKDG
jgi:hypothetical protein